MYDKNIGRLLTIINVFFSTLSVMMMTNIISSCINIRIEEFDQSLILIWSSCCFYILSDGLILLYTYASNKRDENQRLDTFTHSNIGIDCNILLSSCLYIFIILAYVYCIDKLGPSLQSSIDSFQVIFLMMIKKLTNEDHNPFGWIQVVGLLIYILGIYMSSVLIVSHGWSIAFSFIIVFLSVVNGILFEEGVKRVDVIQYMFMQSIVCFCILTVLNLVYSYFYISQVKMDVQVQTIFIYAGIRHVINLVSTYSEAYAIKYIGYYEFIKIQTIVSPLLSFIFQSIFLMHLDWIAFLYLLIVVVGLYFIFIHKHEYEHVNSSEEEIKLLIVS